MAHNTLNYRHFFISLENPEAKNHTTGVSTLAIGTTGPPPKRKGNAQEVHLNIYRGTKEPHLTDPKENLIFFANSSKNKKHRNK